MSDAAQNAATSQPSPAATAPSASGYRVLARKYRPATFDDLIGQDAMVRTISNAFESRPHSAGLDPHRRARRRQDHDGPHPRARAQLRAAGRLGHRADHQHAEARRALPGDHGQPPPRRASRWTPPRTTASTTCARSTTRSAMRRCSARYKVYILDEVHMLSGAAFNALLKTLEEPPPHAKFVFATTEIRKVPVTVLSRCQRFDLRRVDAELLVKHLRRHRRQGEDRGRARGARADRARGGRLGARFAVAVRSGDRARGRARCAPRTCGRCSGLPTAPASSTCSRR